YDFMVFTEGHPLQIEFAGVPNNCWNCGLAKQFVRFLLQPEAQKILMAKNFMHPAVAGIEAGTIYSELPKVQHLPAETLNEFVQNQKEILEHWQKARRSL